MTKLLLLSCCAPCSCGVIKKLALERKDFAVLFYNPNIDTFEEYAKRLAEQKRLCLHFDIPFYELEYTPHLWAAEIAGLEGEPERGKRCAKCFYIRLKAAAKYAKSNGFESFSSVLGFSRYKDLEQVNQSAALAAEEEAIAYDSSNWRKGGACELQKDIIEELALYCQKYCGCKFSHR